MKDLGVQWVQWVQIVQWAQKEKWTGTLLHLYSHIGNSHRAHQQISTGIRAQLVAYINFAGCLHSCPYIYDKRESFGNIRQNFVVY